MRREKMDNVRQLNKQFYKYWKKESIEWRPILLVAWLEFLILEKLSKRVNECIYKMILKLLESKLDYIDDKSVVMDLVGVNVSAQEYQALLIISGYYYHKPSGGYYINKERVKMILNVCDATNMLAKEVECVGLFEKITEMRMEYYRKRKDCYERKYEKLALNNRITALRIEPANGERGQFINHVAGKIFLIALVGAVIILGLYVSALYLNKSGQVEETKMTFWNSLLGVCIPGVITIITTYLLIKHEYKVDYHKERMSALPVFSFMHVHDKKQYIGEYGQWNNRIYPCEIFENTAENDNISDEEVDLYILRNRGSGMAFNVSHDRGDQNFMFGDIAQHEEKIIAMKKYPALYYVISYMDIYGNKYTQRFEMENCNGGYNITTFPPELVLRTKLVRYQQ